MISLNKHEITIQEVSDYSQTVADSQNQVADQVNHLLKDGRKRCSNLGKNWADWTPVDQEQEEGQETQAPVREEPRPPSQQPVMENPTTSVGSLITDIAGCNTSFHSSTKRKGLSLHLGLPIADTYTSVDSRVCILTTCSSVVKGSDKNICRGSNPF